MSAPFLIFIATRNSSQDYMAPTLRTGNLRIAVEFDRSLLEELVVLVFSQYPNSTYIDKGKKVGTSFIPI
jgi:hypothetical protein